MCKFTLHVITLSKANLIKMFIHYNIIVMDYTKLNPFETPIIRGKTGMSVVVWFSQTHMTRYGPNGK